MVVKMNHCVDPVQRGQSNGESMTYFSGILKSVFLIQLWIVCTAMSAPGF